MGRTECGATVVLAMKRRRTKSGQALIEYAFLMVLLATITFAVVALAGNQLSGSLLSASSQLTIIHKQELIAPPPPC